MNRKKKKSLKKLHFLPSLGSTIGFAVPSQADPPEIRISSRDMWTAVLVIRFVNLGFVSGVFLESSHPQSLFWLISATELFVEVWLGAPNRTINNKYQPSMIDG